ncbi:unnamed protein product [Clonostachys rosea]|uniref:AB hydrolase-1 domain-containing protein n=1 Tax=Bionectria ochroleuca TaxID=29856 RepID=A0ABY6UXI8_BIOOC|nr:unnamed protein product [Clonostachys rosea]
MVRSLAPTLRSSIWAVAAPLGLYAIFIGLAATPFFQRHFLYAHKVNTLSWTDVNEPERWGFARNQVTPFKLNTSDGERLYAWHLLPLPLYLQNEASLAAQTPGLADDVTTTESFRLLKHDPEARLVLHFHGNAGHIAQAFRPFSYHTLTDTSSYHVLAVDYRGFGHSTGVPSESGLIEDGSALVEWAINVAGVPPERIVLLGQSLGTAVVSGVAERYALKGVEFAGIVLVAGFSDLTSMLSEYRIHGLVPVLAPFRKWPPLLRLLEKSVVDKWHSADRLSTIVQSTKSRLRLNLVHSFDDPDIPWTEDNKLFKAAVQGKEKITNDAEFEAWKLERTNQITPNAFRTTWKASPNIIVHQELFPYGGHNNIMGSAPVTLAIMRSFELHGTTYAS